MLIDWFTVAAQLINFLVLVWLLKRFLYKPVLKAIDEREKRIVMQLQEAENKKAEADREREEFQRKNNEFDQLREGLMTDAVNEAKNERQRLVEETRKEVEALRLQLHETLRNEHQTLNQEIMRRIREEVFAISRKALSDLASADLETHMADVFTHRLKKMDNEEKKQLLTAFSSNPHQLTVRSMFELPMIQKSAIQQTIQETLDSKAKVNFEIVTHLISGIELITNGYKITWNIEEYLVSLQNSLSKLLEENAV